MEVLRGAGRGEERREERGMLIDRIDLRVGR